jgi:hypothetical protein
MVIKCVEKRSLEEKVLYAVWDLLKTLVKTRAYMPYTTAKKWCKSGVRVV